ncbi:unnamed protein product [Meganyctiphanes norvegica]|uniref:Uncharacterized protein n=1 Tax=Meganyctiphanes norvegica TaxID=48144 RepID=A0AAV2Q8Q8_MEGNR
MRDAKLTLVLLILGVITVVISESNHRSPLPRSPHSLRWRRHLLPSFLEHKPHSHNGFIHGRPEPPHREQQPNSPNTPNIYPSVTFAQPPPLWVYVEDSQKNDPILTVTQVEANTRIPFNTIRTSSTLEYKPFTTNVRPNTSKYNPHSLKYTPIIPNDNTHFDERYIIERPSFIRSTSLLSSSHVPVFIAPGLVTEFIPNRVVHYPSTSVSNKQISQLYIPPPSNNICNSVENRQQSVCILSTVTNTRIHYVTVNQNPTVTVCPVSPVIDYLPPVSSPAVDYLFQVSSHLFDYLPPFSQQISSNFPPVNIETITKPIIVYSTITSTPPPIIVTDVETTTQFKTSTLFRTSIRTEVIPTTSTLTRTAYIRNVQTVTVTLLPKTTTRLVTATETLPPKTVFQPVVETLTEIRTEYSQYCNEPLQSGYGYQVPTVPGLTFNN